MLKLKLQYLGHLMQRADSLEKTLMLGKNEGRRRGMTENETVEWHHQMDISLCEVQDIVKDTEAWHVTHHGSQRTGQDWTTEQQQQQQQHGPNIPDSYAILFFTTSGFTFTTRHIHDWVSFSLWPSTSLFLELLVISFCSSPVLYWTLLGRLFFQCLIFLHFHSGHGFSWQAYWGDLPFPPPVDHVLPELFTMTIHLV